MRFRAAGHSIRTLTVVVAMLATMLICCSPASAGSETPQDASVAFGSYRYRLVGLSGTWSYRVDTEHAAGDTFTNLETTFRKRRPVRFYDWYWPNRGVALRGSSHYTSTGDLTCDISRRLRRMGADADVGVVRISRRRSEVFIRLNDDVDQSGTTCLAALGTAHGDGPWDACKGEGSACATVRTSRLRKRRVEIHMTRRVTEPGDGTEGSGTRTWDWDITLKLKRGRKIAP